MIKGKVQSCTVLWIGNDLGWISDTDSDATFLIVSELDYYEEKFAKIIQISCLKRPDSDLHPDPGIWYIYFGSGTDRAGKFQLDSDPRH